MIEISIGGLVISLVPILFVIWLNYKWLDEKTKIAYATFRMVFQLIIIGYVLIYIFEYKHIILGIAILTFMTIASAVITLRNCDDKTFKHFSIIVLSIALSSLTLLFLTTQVILNLEHFYEPRFDIPIAGMLLANSMNSLSISIERFSKEIKRGESFISARNTAFKSSMIPQINTFFAVGLVSLPGMMTGQILSGTDPLIAVRYQIVIMSMILSSAALSNYFYYTFSRNK